MNDDQRRRYERDQRVDVYMGAAAADFPGGSRGGALIDRLKGLLAQVAALELERAANKSKRRQGTEGREKTRKTLRGLVKAVWDTYKTIVRDHPEHKGLFGSPSRSNNDQELITTARAYADAAAPLAAHFAEYGLAADFFDDLRAQADALEAHIARQNAGAGAGVGATASVEATLRELDEVVESLGTLVRNKYRDDPPKLAAWESASRVERAPRRRPQDDGDPPPPPPANT